MSAQPAAQAMLGACKRSELLLGPVWTERVGAGVPADALFISLVLRPFLTQPMLRQEVAEGDVAVLREDDAAVEVSGVDLGHGFPAAAAGREDSGAGDGHDGSDVGPAVLEHLADGRDLGAEAKPQADTAEMSMLSPGACPPNLPATVAERQ